MGHTRKTAFGVRSTIYRSERPTHYCGSLLLSICHAENVRVLRSEYCRLAAYYGMGTEDGGSGSDSAGLAVGTYDWELGYVPDFL